MIRAVISVLGLMTSLAFGGSVSDLIQEHQIHPRGRIPSTPLLRAYAEVRSSAQSGVSSDLLGQVFFVSLKRKGIVFASAKQENLKKAFVSGASIDTALAPKLVLEVEVRREENDYAVQSELKLFEYECVNQHCTAHVTWTKSQALSGVVRRDLDENLIRLIQTQVSAFARTRLTQQPRLVRASLVTTSSSSRYETKWVDPDSRRGKFYLGLSTGSPAWVNGHFGFWGTRSVPLLWEISGGYTSTTNRGLIAQVGWIRDNESYLKHGVGISFAALNVDNINESTEPDALGRPVTLVTETTSSIRQFIGPTYFFDWNGLRLQGGVAFPIGSANTSGPRVLIQLGYMPSLGW